MSTLNWRCYRCFIFIFCIFCSQASIKDVAQNKYIQQSHVWMMKQKSFSFLNDGIYFRGFGHSCNLNVFVWDSWVSALSAGSIARGRPEVVSLPWYSPHLSLSLSLSDASLADSVLTCLGRNAPTFQCTFMFKQFDNEECHHFAA